MALSRNELQDSEVSHSKTKLETGGNANSSSDFHLKVFSRWNSVIERRGKTSLRSTHFANVFIPESYNIVINWTNY